MTPESYPGDSDPTAWLLGLYAQVQWQYECRVRRGEDPGQVRASMFVATAAQAAITRRAIEDAFAGRTDATLAASDVVWELSPRGPAHE